MSADTLHTEKQLGVAGFSQLASPVMNVDAFSNVCELPSTWHCMLLRVRSLCKARLGPDTVVREE